MADCIFCKIIAGEISANELYRGDGVIAIADVNPQAPSHTLVLPLEHRANIGEFVRGASPEVVAELFQIAARFGQEQGANGYRLVINTGEAGGQTVDHLHVHVLAGRQMHWPPG